MWRALLIPLTLIMLGDAAHARDLHRWWDLNCGGCHGHSAAFARQFLKVVDGRLVGVHPDRDLRLFLGNHGVPRDEIEAVHAMLLAQATSQPEFKARCGGCHGAAAELARRSIIVRDGVLYGRRSSQRLREFLDGHAGIRADEVAFYLDLLTRLEREVREPRP